MNHNHTRKASQRLSQNRLFEEPVGIGRKAQARAGKVIGQTLEPLAALGQKRLRQAAKHAVFIGRDTVQTEGHLTGVIKADIRGISCGRRKFGSISDSGIMFFLWVTFVSPHREFAKRLYHRNSLTCIVRMKRAP